MKHFLEKPYSSKPLRMVRVILFALLIEKKENDGGRKKDSTKKLSCSPWTWASSLGAPLQCLAVSLHGGTFRAKNLFCFGISGTIQNFIYIPSLLVCHLPDLRIYRMNSRNPSPFSTSDSRVQKEMWRQIFWHHFLGSPGHSHIQDKGMYPWCTFSRNKRGVASHFHHYFLPQITINVVMASY